MSIWVDRYSIVDGAVREHGPWFVERLRTRGDETVRLLVLADPVDERSAEFCAEVAEAVAELFARESLSVTGGLLRALRQAHSNLAEWNRRSLREHRVAVGITCVVLRDGEVTVAQAGPGIIYLTGPEGLQRLATEDGEEAAYPIGGSEAVEPRFVSVRLAGRLVLLLSSVVERTLGSAPIVHALEAGAERALADLFLRTREIRDMTAVLVAEVDLPEGVAENAVRAPTAERPRAQPWHDPQGASQPPVPLVDSGAEFIAPRRFSLPSLRRARAAYGAPGAPGMLARVGVRRGLREIGAGQRQWRAVLLPAAALVVVAALASFTVPGLIRPDTGARLEDALAVAQAHIAAAAGSAEVARSRTELEAATAEIARARAMQPGNARVEALQRTVDARAQSLDAVIELGDSGLKRVQAFEGVITAPFNPAAMVAGAGALWMVDSERGRLFRIDPSGRTEPQEVYRSGTNYGGITARDPRVVTWDAGVQRVLLVDAGPTLFSIVPGRPPVPIALRGAADLKSIAAIATYTNNLYVLDPQGGEIWRYLPASTGFDSERTGLLGGSNLADARGLAVDGDFFVLGASAVRHFRPLSELQPLLQGIDRPISSPAGIAFEPQRRLFYIGDRGGRRVVVSDREGFYKRQYRSPQFFDVRGIALAADGSTVYVLTGTGIASFAPTP